MSSSNPSSPCVYLLPRLELQAGHHGIYVGSETANSHPVAWTVSILNTESLPWVRTDFFFFFLFIGYFLYLHFKCYPLSQFPSLLETPYHIHFLLLLWGCKLYLGYSKFLGKYPLINEYISCEFLCDRVTSLRMISSIHLPKNFINSLFLILE